jgi:hypothetical protein
MAGRQPVSISMCMAGVRYYGCLTSRQEKVQISSIPAPESSLHQAPGCRRWINLSRSLLQQRAACSLNRSRLRLCLQHPQQVLRSSPCASTCSLMAMRASAHLSLLAGMQVKVFEQRSALSGFLLGLPFPTLGTTISHSWDYHFPRPTSEPKRAACWCTGTAGGRAAAADDQGRAAGAQGCGAQPPVHRLPAARPFHCGARRQRPLERSAEEGDQYV